MDKDFLLRLFTGMVFGMISQKSCYLTDNEMEIYKELVKGANTATAEELKEIERRNATAKRVIVETQAKARCCDGWEHQAHNWEELYHLADNENAKLKERIAELETIIREPHETAEDLIFGEN